MRNSRFPRVVSAFLSGLFVCGVIAGLSVFIGMFSGDSPHRPVSKLLLMEGVAHAAQSTQCTGTISSLATPTSDGGAGVTISSSGVWCVMHNLSFDDGGHANTKAILVNASNVTLDLNGYWLNYAGSGTTFFGIYTNSSNLIVQNGTVNGFYYGVYFDSFGYYPIAKDVNVLNVSGSGAGIYVGGGNPYPFETVIDHCVITAASGASMAGIYLAGSDANISNCRINGQNTGGEGIWVDGYGSAIIDSNNIMRGNYGIRVSSTVSYASINGNSITGANTYGIYVNATDATLDSNRIVHTTYGLYFPTGTTSKYLNTITAGCSTPFECLSGACTSVGNNS